MEKWRRYDLHPVEGQNVESFYGKAYVIAEEDGTETLFSYNTPIIRRNPDGTLARLWSGYSAKTGKHVFAFCGI